MAREKGEDSFELCNEGEIKLGVAFSSVEECTLGQLPFGFGANRGGSFERGSSPCDRFRSRDQLRTAGLDLRDASFNLHFPRILDPGILEQTRTQVVRELSAFLSGELHRLGFNRF